MQTYTVNQDGWLDGNYRTKGEPVQMTEEQAKWLVLGDRISEAAPSSAGAPAEALPTAKHPLDHDNNGKAGGSMKAQPLLDDVGAAELAEMAERNEVDFNTLRSTARKFLGDKTPGRKELIVAALKAL